MAKKPRNLQKAGDEAEETTAAGGVGQFDAREAVEQILSAANAVDDPAPLLAMLAEKAPIALAEVCCGARAPGGARFVLASIPHAAALEAQLTPRGVWGRLVDLAGDIGTPNGAATTALRVACERNPAASWILKLSRKVEGTHAGLTHLVACARHPSFAQSCFTHAEAGNIEGLVLAAEATGRPEPAAALLDANPAAAIRAAAGSLRSNPQSAVVAHLAGVYGPEPDPLIARLVSHLTTRAAAEGLLAQSGLLPHTSRMLRAVIPGMAR